MVVAAYVRDGGDEGREATEKEWATVLMRGGQFIDDTVGD